VGNGGEHGWLPTSEAERALDMADNGNGRRTRSAYPLRLPNFDRLTRLARAALGVDVAGISLIKDGRLWIESIAGWDIDELPLDGSLCSAVVERNDSLTIPDLRAAPQSRHHPLVISEPHFRFYAGHPIRDRSGRLVGSFFLYDTRARDTEPVDPSLSADFAALVQGEFHHLQAELAAERSQQRLLQKLDTARNEALVDPLTGVWNRRAGFDALARDFQDGPSADGHMAVFMVDLDRFKQINDRHGHPVGDRVLQRIAGILADSVREEDVVARYGGDEFLVIMQVPGKTGLRTALNRLSRNLTDITMRTRTGDLRVSASVGGILVEGWMSADDMVVAADDALLRAKEGARKSRSATRRDDSGQGSLVPSELATQGLLPRVRDVQERAGDIRPVLDFDKRARQHALRPQ
jgi:diguanylate cyclase (GGDEF)-like protein